MQHEQNLHWLECDYDGKADFRHIRSYVKPYDGKVAQTTTFKLIWCGLGLHGGLPAHNHIHTYKTQFPLNQIKGHKNE
jgi:hypothetical protein